MRGRSHSAGNGPFSYARTLRSSDACTPGAAARAHGCRARGVSCHNRARMRPHHNRQTFAGNPSPQPQNEGPPALSRRALYASQRALRGCASAVSRKLFRDAYHDVANLDGAVGDGGDLSALSGVGDDDESGVRVARLGYLLAREGEELLPLATLTSKPSPFISTVSMPT